MTARSLKKADPHSAEAAADAAMTTRVIESLVLRGDISGLDAADRARFYVQMCEAFGLNPRTQPFAILRLNGKEVLYPTRGATDQLAAIHRLNREIVDGPKVVDLQGTKLVYAVCRATHPNGRIETAVATVPLTDPQNCLMKAETKAKRRATLSMLGLGMLDETEFETIPSHAKTPVAPIDVSLAGTPANDTTVDAAEPAASEVPPALESFRLDVEQIELPGEAVALWLKHRAALSQLAATERESAWKMLCVRTEQVGRMKNAKVWLKRAIAEDDARRGQAENNQFA